MIEAFIDNFSRTFFDFTDVDKHSGDLVDSTAKNKIGSVISTAAVARGGFRTKRRQVFAIGPRRKKQPARGRELKPFADRQKHDAANILRVIIQRANAPDSTLTCRFATSSPCQGENGASGTSDMAGYAASAAGSSRDTIEVRVLYSFESERNSERVRASSSNEPSRQDVFMIEFCFSTPRIIMQRCFASTTTATPFGSRQSIRDCAISVVRFS